MKTVIVIGISIFIFVSNSVAGVIIGGTRVIYNQDSKSVEISVENPDESPYLIQSWIDDSDEKKQPYFIITPPLFRLNEQKSNSLRIFLTKNKLPDDKETLFWLNIKTIPASKKLENSLQIAFKTKIKLIYRPNVLKNVDFIREQNKLLWEKSGNMIIVKNPTPYYFNFQEIIFNSNKVKDVSYVAPFSKKEFFIKNSENHGNLMFNIINDFGATTENFDRKL